MTKKRDLERDLARAGGTPLRAGGNHDVWLMPDGKKVTVPRYREIPNWTAEQVRKEAGLR